MEDIGADLGILAEYGFQPGAKQATVRSEVVAISLADLRRAAASLAEQRLRNFPARLSRVNANHWAMPKEHRIEHGLRPGVGFNGYSATHVLAGARAVLLAGLTDDFRMDSFFGLPDAKIQDRAAAIAWLDSNLDDLERRINIARAAFDQSTP
ncbi:hypothetical protein [Amnibacterium soli]|uniref:hypothetical protein n=1 Tax=Amnibacterium soli TaxID=1282736 RepID=UPI0031E51F41